MGKIKKHTASTQGFGILPNTVETSYSPETNSVVIPKEENPYVAPDSSTSVETIITPLPKEEPATEGQYVPEAKVILIPKNPAPAKSEVKPDVVLSNVKVETACEHNSKINNNSVDSSNRLSIARQAYKYLGGNPNTINTNADIRRALDEFARVRWNRIYPIEVIYDKLIKMDLNKLFGN